MKSIESASFPESDILPYQTTSLVEEKVVVFAPHPDDETVGCGGAIAAHCRHGDQVKIVILTNGNKADTLNRYSSKDYVEIRKSEAQKAASILGVKDIEYWEYQDRELKPDDDLICRLSNLLEEYAPTLIYCPSPTEVHPDHRFTSQALWETLLRVKTPPKVAFYELGIPFRPNTLVDITPYIEAKKNALKTYESQQAENDYYSKILGLNKYRTYTLSPQVEYAEGYYIIPSEKIGKIPFDTLELCIFHPLPRTVLEKNPLVSVIVRTHNRPHLLRNCLKSLLVQTYKNFQVVLVNDGGEDIEGLIREFEGQLNINYIKHATQKGRSASVNTGIKNSQGLYLAFLDDDDIYYPNHLMILVRYITDRDCKVAYTSVASKIYKNGLTGELELVGDGERFDDDFDKDKILFRNYIPFICIMFNRSVVEEIGSFDEDMVIFEDWDYLIRVSRLYSFLHIEETTAEYRYYNEVTIPNHNFKYNTDEWYLKLYSKHKRYINEKSLLQYTKTIAESMDDKDRQIQSLLQSIEDKDILLSHVYGSLGWRLFNSLNRCINKCYPPGTKRRKWYDTVIKGIKFIIHHKYNQK